MLVYGKVLLLDAARHRVAEIDEFVHLAHPEAVCGSVGWSLGSRDLSGLTDYYVSRSNIDRDLSYLIKTKCYQ